MRSIYVADVGDGLCTAIKTIFGEVIQIDSGGRNVEVAAKGLKRIFNHFHGIDVFFLSHFHIDRYNGLLYSSFHGQGVLPLGIGKVYYPRVPEFKRKKEFVYALFTINLRVFGSETGVMEYDFLKAISRLNLGISPTHRGVSRGDLIEINGSVFECLWPPTVIYDKRTLNIIRKALENFEEALEQDDETRHLYNRVTQEEIVSCYLEEDAEKHEYKTYENDVESSIGEKRRLPQVVRDANSALRKAANHLGLAIFEDNRFLFLGDAESFEIRQIVHSLESKGREDFYIFLTPHHGTHWNKSLGQIRCLYSITSNGSKLCSLMKPHFKEISARSLATFANGDIIIPTLHVTRFTSELRW